MLVLFDRQNQSYSFQDYRRLYSHLDRLERDRHAKNGLEATPDWILCCHSPHRVNNWYAYAAEHPRTSREEQELGVVEIIRGNLKDPLFIPVTPKTSLDNLQMDWCKAYCKNRGYTLIETLNPRYM